MSELKRCPLCNSEFELDTDKRYYIHPSVGCFFDYLPMLVDDEDIISKWNTRKPLERIVERLEEQKSYADDLDDDLSCGEYTGLALAIKIVKEEGGMNE